jgi:endo-alpha-1,4-polygalactosaminidase (GH114 family)
VIRTLVGAAVAALVVGACGDSTPSGSAIALPPAGSDFDYQLGGAYPPPPGVAVVVRDRHARPVDAYSICYINGFQTQPDEADWWLAEHPDLVLRTPAGEPVMDPEWPDEMLLDLTTRVKRDEVAAIVGSWIDRCATDGFDAVEIDNLDSYTRSAGRIHMAAAVSTIALMADRAHAAGLPIGQKNAAQLLDRREDTDLDFAVAEECSRYDECDDYVAAYGNRVYLVEYRRDHFDAVCAAYPGLAVVQRDRGLEPAGAAGYVRRAC